MPEDSENGSTSGDEETSAEAIAAEKMRGDDDAEDQDEEKEGMHGYESEREPGERVRVARMTREPDEQTAEGERADEGADSEEHEEEGEGDAGESFDVTVRGEGPTEPESEEGAAPQDSDDVASSAESDGSDDAADVSGESPGADDPTESTSFEPDVAMDDFDDAGESATTEDFAAMFEGQGVPERKDYSSGDRVKGEVLEIADRFIFVQLDPQTEGVAKRREFEDDDGELDFDVGDTREFYVTYATDDEVQLGRHLEGDEGSIDAIREAHDKGVPVEGKVTGTNKGGFEVEVHGVDAFCPISEIELGFTDEKEVHVGASYRFKVTEVRDGGDSVVLSRAELLREERAEQAQQTLDELEEGAVVEGIVTRTTNFGAFVDLGGVEGLVHISELSHRHFDHASDVVEEGEKVEVEVQEIELPEAGDSESDPRISLSRKATERDPWEIVNEEFAVGENVEGTVVRNAPFGAFVEIAPGVEGLCHVSEMSWTEHVRTPDEIVEPGEKVTVQVQDIDLPRKRISLSMKDAEGNPWDDVGEEYAVGMRVEGEVENIEDFGVFVQLPTGITALIPRSEMNLPSGVTPFRKYSEGDHVEAEVLNIDPAERKMALTPLGGESESSAAAEGDEAADQPEAQRSGAPANDSGGSQEEGGFGTLGDLIGDELEDRD